MNDIKDIVTKPIFFERNRVYRIYHGGKPFKSLFDDGYDDGTDNMFPEEWVASKVRAINPKNASPAPVVSTLLHLYSLGTTPFSPLK